MINTITVVSVTHNSTHLLEAFLLRLSTGAREGDEIFVVDSGSADVDLAAEISARSDARFQRLPTNLGFGAGSNHGARLAESEWLAFVNPDVDVSFDDLHALAQSAEASGITCIGPQITTMDGDAVITNRPIPSPPWKRPRNAFVSAGAVTISPSISGCCMLIRREDFLRLRGFDEYFFMFCEEIDLHARIGAAGGLVGASSTTTVRTPGGGSSNGTSRRWSVTERSVAHVRYMRKHFGLATAALDFVWRGVQIALLPEFKPKRLSAEQFIRGVRQVRTASHAYGKKQ